MTLVSSVQIISAVVTATAFVVAFFREDLRAWLRPPKLSLELLPTERGVTRLDGEQKKYRHVRVTNHRRSAPAHNVKVFLTEIREVGRVDASWRGEVPMVWRYEREKTHPLQRTVGTPADCDLCSVVQGDDCVAIEAVSVPINGTMRLPNKKSHLLSLIARADECDSNTVHLEVSWDGDWTADERAFDSHLKLGVAQ